MSGTSDNKEGYIQVTSQTTSQELNSTGTEFVPYKRKVYPTNVSQPWKRFKFYESVSKRRKRRAAVSKVIVFVFYG